MRMEFLHAATGTQAAAAGANIPQTIILAWRFDRSRVLAGLGRKIAMFTDQVEIVARSGKGGDGMVQRNKQETKIIGLFILRSED